MDIVLSPKSEKPIYEQIYQQIASQIISGEIAGDFCLPSIRNIALELRISVITVKKAWELLENNGLIYSVAGKGCFVTGHAKPALEDKKFALAKERLSKELPFYQELQITKEEMIELIKKFY